jgi:glycyl-tRNA synthetase beta chain
MSTQALLVELLTEELPPKALKRLGEAFAAGIADGLNAAGLLHGGSVVEAFATPRRLGVHISAVAARGPDQAKREKVLPVNVAFNADGTPQPPLLKKLASMGLGEADIPRLERASDGKAEALFYSSTVQGQTIFEALQETLHEALKNLPIPKVMFYERDDGTAVHFVRPAHKLVALHGAAVVPVNVFGLEAASVTKGHRFHSSDEVVLSNANDYSEALRSHHVIASFAERRAMIEQQLHALAKGDEVVMPEALLDEVTALVEWPRVYECHFDKEFLEVPQECLILTMQTNQKYFATRKDGKLTHRFLIVSNLDIEDPSLITQGNERVVRPRLADAKFFFTQDKKRTLASRVPDLARVVYHNKLGSQGERVARVRAIAQQLGKAIGGNDLAEKASRAAELAKADLLTDMVGEFPELQGIMGTYYAAHDGEDAEVAKAITEQYLPRFAGDALPSTPTGIALALADKLETLAGMFAIGQQPTGDKDPYALRRHALGVIRLLIERKLPLSLPELCRHAFATFVGKVQAAEGSQDALLSFIFDRLIGYLRDLGYSAQEVEAVVTARPVWGEIPKCLQAVRAFAQLPEAEALAAANKRISNILKKSSQDGVAALSPALLVEPAEQALHSALQSVKPQADTLFSQGQYAESLKALAALKLPVDAFFDKVMVNADDAALRTNRLALLHELHGTMNRVADLSKLAA